MSKTENNIRVLLIDDNSIDRQLFDETLRKAKIRFITLIAGSLPELDVHLTNQDFDLIISEAAVHGYADLEVLQLVKAKVPDIPVLIFTRNTSVDIAVRSIKMGAEDFISKSPEHLQKLVNAVLTVQAGKIIGGEKNSTSNISHKSTEIQQSDFNKLPVAIILSTFEGRILSANETSCKLFDHTETELCKIEIQNLAGFNALQLTVLLNESKKSGFSRGEIVLFKKGGSIFEAEITVTKSTGHTGNAGLCITVRDISGQLKTENVLLSTGKKYRHLFEDNPLPMWICNIDTLAFLDVNHAAIKQYGYAKAEFMKMKLSDICTIEGEQKTEQDFHSSAHQSIFKGEWKHIKKNGEVFNVEIISHPIKFKKREARLVLSNDVSSNWLAQEQLRKLSQAVQQNPVSIVITDVEGNIEYVNPKFSQLTGYKLHEVIGKNPRILKSGITSDEEYKLLWDTIKAGKEWRGEFQNCKKNGEIYTEFASISPIADANGIITHFVASKEDITERKRSEKLIKTLSSAIEQSPSSIIITNDKGKIDFVNTQFTTFMQYSAQEVLGRIPRIFNPEHSSGERFELMWQTLKDGKLWHGENQNRKKDGTYFWENVSISSLMDAEGMISNYILIMEDVSEKKKMLDDLIIAKEKAEESEEIFSQFMKHSPIYVFFKDEKIRPIILSQNYEQMLGLPMRELLGKSMFELYPSETAKNMVEDDLRILSENKIFEVEERFNGQHFKTIKFPIHVKGKPRFLAGYTLDISEHKQAEIVLKEKNDELIKAIEKAKESDRLKTAFLANMSHEIRTPMNGILGFTELLKTPNLSGIKQQEFIYLIRKSGERMLNIINNIIDISKIESGLMEVSASETDINEQITFIHSFFSAESDQKGLKIYTSTPLSTAQANILTDKEKVYAILINLVKNAIKFTSQGSIKFGYELKKNHLEFFVQDTGVGIPPEQQKFIFERFRQGNESLARKHEGAGLGLSITKAYVEMLGGKIWVESEIGIGSTFYFTTPYLVSSDEKISPHINNSVPVGKKPLQKLKILIAEDDEFSAMLITNTIQPFCKELYVTGNGAEAVEELQNYPDIDLVLMDISMPVMDGFEATRKIRLFNKDVIIIAQTAYGLLGDKEKALKAGCNDHISKPIRKKDLSVLISKYFDGVVNANS